MQVPPPANMQVPPPTKGLPIATPANMIPVQVVRREVVAPDAVTIYLVLPGTKQAPGPYLPGQFITLAFPTPRETLYRSYSLCGDGNPRMPWEITIKRQHMGSVSTHISERVQEGSLLFSSLPRGSFTLPTYLSPETPLVFVSAGSGITPIFGMLRRIAGLQIRDRPPVQLHYASKSPKLMIYYRQLEEMDPYQLWLTKWYYFSQDENRMTTHAILENTGRLLPNTHWYMCGPEEMKQGLIEELKKSGVTREFIHAEVFATQVAGPAYRMDHSGAQGGKITVQETGAVLTAEPQEPLLVALERQDYHPAFSCRIGMCGACKLRLLEGTALPQGEVLSSQERNQGYVLSCIAVPQGDVVLESAGRPPAGATAKRRAVSVKGPARDDQTVNLIRIVTLVVLVILLFIFWNVMSHNTMNVTPMPTQAAPTTLHFPINLEGEIAYV
jgi:ring-1,2-phenylacetyl-CoA epoxidase subunit PaaE